jgi:aspartyl-tRNA(Asn)/glutamyl-tRNA(Gln) amidotransferase subunit A
LLTAADYLGIIAKRRETIEKANAMFQAFDAILLPSTPRIAPRISDVSATDEAYFDANIAMLRNPGVFNFLDGTALSIPCHQATRLLSD